MSGSVARTTTSSSSQRLTRLLFPLAATAEDIKKASQNPASGAGVQVGENVSTAVTKLNNGNTIPTVSVCESK